MVPAVYTSAIFYLPKTFHLQSTVGDSDLSLTPLQATVCVAMGAIGGLIIGLITEYYTSHSYSPVREVAQSCKTGAATNMIYGIALGFKSAIIPVLVLAFVIYMSFSLCDMYGVALAAIGFLSNLATGLTIDVYGPVCDNAGGIAEMAELHPSVREKTDALDAAGNTTAAIGKGFAIGSAALVSLALFGAFVTRIRAASDDDLFASGVNMLEPVTFAFLIVGGMIPFAFAALTMKSVGMAAMEMVLEVQRQFDEKPHLLDENPEERPDYDACIAISTQASLKEMVAPGAMVIFTPLATGILFGVTAVSGLLVGALVASIQLAISMSNSGGAWDNAKKWIEAEGLQKSYTIKAGQYGDLPTSDMDLPKNLAGKGSEWHDASVVGDTIGDPFKDTSGPALNILIKLMTMMSLVMAPRFSNESYEFWWVGVLIGIAAVVLSAGLFFGFRAAELGKVEIPNKNAIKIQVYGIPSNAVAEKLSAAVETFKNDEDFQNLGFAEVELKGVPSKIEDGVAQEFYDVLKAQEKLTREKINKEAGKATA